MAKYTQVDGSSKINEYKEGSKKLAAETYYSMLALMEQNPDKFFVFTGAYGASVTFLFKKNKAGYHPVMQLGYGQGIEFIYAKYVDGEMVKDPANRKLNFKTIKLHAGNVGMDKKFKLCKVRREGDDEIKVDTTGEVCF